MSQERKKYEKQQQMRKHKQLGEVKFMQLVGIFYVSLRK